MTERHEPLQKGSGWFEDIQKLPWYPYADLGLLVGLCVLLGALIYLFPNSPLRIPTGLLLVFYAPGYSLLAALYPSVGPISQGQRVWASVGLSAIVSGLVYLLVAYTIGISLSSTTWVMLAWVVAIASIAGFRRCKLSPAERFSPRLGLHLPGRKVAVSLGSWMVLVQVVAVMALCLAAARLLWVSSHTVPRFTEFYLLRPGGVAGFYPEETVVGEPISLIIGVANHEHSTIRYRVETTIQAESAQIASMELRHGEAWEQPYNFALIEPGENQRVEFLLYKGDEEEPYRSLHLWMTVREE